MVRLDLITLCSAMGVFITLLVLLSIACCCYAADDCSSTPVRPIAKLREKLFCNYDKNSLPVKNSSLAVPVHLEFLVFHVDLSGHDEIASIQGVLRFMWEDQYLTWDPMQHEEVRYIRLGAGEVWEPDLTLNIMTGINSGKVEPSECVLFYTGVISCAPQVDLSTPCVQDVRHWPYDEHNCSFTVSSFLYYASELNLTRGRFGVGGMAKSRFWEFRSVTAVRKVITFEWSNLSYPQIEYAILMKRHAGSYAAGTVLPVFLMLSLVLSTFWLGTMVTSRVVINSFVLTGSITFLNYLLYLVPQNGNVVPIIVTLHRDCMSLATFGIIMAVFVKLFSTSSLKPPGWLCWVSDWLELSFVGRLLFLVEVGPQQEDETTIVEAATTAKPNPWTPILLLIDRIAFLISFVIFFILLVGYIP